MEHRAWTAITQRVAKLEALVDPEDGKRSNVMFGRIPSKVTREALDVMNHELGRINGRLDGAFSKLERDNARLTRDDARLTALEARFEPSEYEKAVASIYPRPGAPLAASVSKAVMSSSGTEILDLEKLKIPCGCIRGRTVSVRDCYLRVETPQEIDGAPPVQIVEVGLAASEKRLLARMLMQSADADEKGATS